MPLASWLLTQAAPELPEPALRGLAAIAAADGITVAAVGMSVVFVALFSLFLLMIALRRLLEPKLPVERVAPAPALSDHASSGDSPGPSPRLVAAIATAVRLEQRRRAAFATSTQAGASSGWGASRSLQWAAHQSIFLRPRR